MATVSPTLLACVISINIFSECFVNGQAESQCLPAEDVCHIQGIPERITTNYSLVDLLVDSGEIHTISCHLLEQCLNQTLSELADNVTSLTLTVDKFPNTGVSFSKFVALRNLSILWKYDTDTFMRDDQIELNDTRLFAGLTKLESLKISIPINTMEDSLLLDLDNLKCLDLSDIKHFSTNKFASLFNGSQLGNKPLNTLILKRMSGVGSGRDHLFLLKELFPLFHRNRLEVLDISNNKVLYLYPGLTQYLPHLKIANIRDNEIRYISEPSEAVCLILEGILHQNLISLDITNVGEIGTEIDYYGSTFTENVANCIASSLGENKCVCQNFKQSCGAFFSKVNCDLLPEYTLAEVTHIEPVAHNPDRYCDGFVLLPFPKSVQVFRIRKSELMYKQPRWRNRTLCFQPNNLKVFDASYVTFNMAVDSNMLVGWDQLEQLDLAYSSWGFYFHDPTFLHTIPQLTILNLTGTNVGIYIRNDTEHQIFEKSLQLRELYLSYAHISFIPYKEFETLVLLQVLDLSSNHLMEVEFLLSPLRSLSMLNISHNSLPRLSSNVTNQLDKLSLDLHVPLELDMQDNTFMCDCHCISFVKWVISTKVTLTDKTSYLCMYKTIGEMSLVTVPTDNLTGECYLVYIATFTVIGISLIIIAVIIFAYKYRWNIRTWLLKMTHGNTTLDPKRFSYDGFVVYSDEDRQWVHNIMMDEIENVRKMKLCVHHRDFIPGDDIDEQIVRSVDNSRKTLLILTKNFLASDWCLYEMKVARNKLQAEGKDVIIPILLAELPDEYMNLSVKNLLREKTYLQWETSMGGQEYFWKKLEIALVGPNKLRTVIQIPADMPESETLSHEGNRNKRNNEEYELLLSEYS